VSLAFIACAIVVLMAPGPLHGLAFRGREDARSHSAGSRLISVALIQLSIGLAADYFIAAGKMEGYHWRVGAAAGTILAMLLDAWIAIPIMLRWSLAPAS
jgi:hypothetical protein